MRQNRQVYDLATAMARVAGQGGNPADVQFHGGYMVTEEERYQALSILSGQGGRGGYPGYGGYGAPIPRTPPFSGGYSGNPIQQAYGDGLMRQNRQVYDLATAMARVAGQGGNPADVQFHGGHVVTEEQRYQALSILSGQGGYPGYGGGYGYGMGGPGGYLGGGPLGGNVGVRVGHGIADITAVQPMRGPDGKMHMPVNVNLQQINRNLPYADVGGDIMPVAQAAAHGVGAVAHGIGSLFRRH